MHAFNNWTIQFMQTQLKVLHIFSKTLNTEAYLTPALCWATISYILFKKIEYGGEFYSKTQWLISEEANIYQVPDEIIMKTKRGSSIPEKNPNQISHLHFKNPLTWHRTNALNIKVFFTWKAWALVSCLGRRLSPQKLRTRRTMIW